MIECKADCRQRGCGLGATCVDAGDEFECRCRDGWSGDPEAECVPGDNIECHRSQDCSSDLSCINNKCKNPCEQGNLCPAGKTCVTMNHHAVCLCLDDCSPSVEICLRDEGCPPNLACVSYQCVDPCNGHACAGDSPCYVEEHKPLCKFCPSGFTIDPIYGCVKAIGCDDSSSCPPSQACINAQCQNPCVANNPCKADEDCKVQDQEATCVTVGCRANTDCPSDEACINKQCKSPCDTSAPCGYSEKCETRDHTAYCIPACDCQKNEDCDPDMSCDGCTCNPTIVQTPEGACGRHEDCASDRECEVATNRCVDPCADNRCASSAICFTVNHQPVCNCPEGYSGNPLLECFIAVGCRDNSACPADEACINGQCRDPCTCGVNAKCEVHNHIAMCKCPPGYQGDPLVFCQVPRNPCDTKPCGEGALCDLDDGHPICSCPKGMTGNPFHKCIPQGDECDNNQCGPNSGCRIIGGAPQCFCLPEYIGNPPHETCKLPENPCEPSPCGPNTDCNIINGYYRCTCRAGFVGSPNTIRGCDKPVNPCAPNPCGPGALCDPGVLNFCYCRPGLVGDPFSGCFEPEPECYPGACGINAECFKIERKLSCRCRSGYAGDAYTVCRAVPDSPCEPSPCGSNSVCSVGNNKSPVCACQAGFFGDPLRPEGCKPECDDDSDCSFDKSCINTRCRDPCPGACGISAHCDVVDHKPQCSCPAGYTGNPYSKCEVISLDIGKEHVTTERPPVSPCASSPCAFNAQCSVEYNVAKCTCPQGYLGDPYSQCRPECLVNNECDADEACSNQRCIKPCTGLCGVNAECEVKNHIAVCYCPDNYSGNPMTRCTELPTREPTPEPNPCYPNPCGPNGLCSPSVGGSFVCSCAPGYLGTPCRPECTSPTDCPMNEDCRNLKCVDPCPGTCGIDAICSVIGHAPICRCREGFTGDPFSRCYVEVLPPVTKDDPCNPSPCGPNSECRVESGRPVCTCLPNFYGGPPNCHPECVVNSQCSTSLACINRKCQDPCKGSCGDRAQCTVQNHKAMCTCPPYLTGDAYSRCIEIPVTRPPVVTQRPDPCAGNPCGPNSKCDVYGNERVCSCLPSYVGSPPQCRPECVRAEECSATKACLGNKCVDPCPGICGVNAECFVVSHNPICSCIHGYTGDPFVRCTEIPPISVTPRPTTPAPPIPAYTSPSTLAPIGEQKEITDEPVTPIRATTTTQSPLAIQPSLEEPASYDPCDPSPCAANADCKTGYDGKPMCQCREGYIGDPLVICGPHCVIDSDCDRGFACIGRECKDPCPGACGSNAVCTVSSHRPKCSCVAGFSGDPYVACIIPPIGKTTTAGPLEPIADYPQPCEPNPCGANAECIPVGAGRCQCIQGYFGNPYDVCRPECTVDSDCPYNRECRNEKCVDPCPGTCGLKAICQVVTHKPMCTCSMGYTGDPYTECRIQQITTEKPRDPCNPSPCGPNAHCRVTFNGRYDCTCLPDYFGQPPDCRPECVVSKDCPNDKACIKQKCRDPCPGVCGIDALCEVRDHNPICFCPKHLTGDPFTRCVPFKDPPLSSTSRPDTEVTIPRHPPVTASVTPTSPASVAVTREPSDPCANNPCGERAECRPDGDYFDCRCPETMYGNPYTKCRPECTINSDCSRDKACVKERCVDPCADACGSGATCSAIMHKPVCTCPYGLSGDPYVACTPITTTSPSTTSVSPRDPVIQGRFCARDSCGVNAVCEDLTGEVVCKCPPSHPEGDAREACSPQCRSNDDCSRTESCINGLCVDPCPGTCGVAAQCIVQNHKPLCDCPHGYTGSPYRQCLPIIAEKEEKVDGPCSENECGPHALCRVENSQPVCTCMPGLTGSPPNCKPECLDNQDCPREAACINQLCQNPCPGACGTGAQCSVHNHSPVCTCDPPLTGNPLVACINATSVRRPCECGPNAQCEALNGQTKCTCYPGYFGNPHTGCRPECVINSDCPKYLSCRNNKCTDPCPGYCGVSALCEVVNHTPVCTCPEGSTGDPLNRCVEAELTPRPPVDPCTPNPCGVYTECHVSGLRPVCSCMPGYLGSPDAGCRPGCVDNSECPPHEACINRQCADPCKGSCDPSAECRVSMHHPKCSCPDGYTGNPFTGCSPRPVADISPCHPDPCGTNALCHVVDVTSYDCRCPPDYYGNPFVECGPECTVNSDCPQYLQCINQKCDNPCPGACGFNAICETVNHQPMCDCPRGLEGDPKVACRTPAVPPIEPECRVNDDCSNELACIELRCQNPCALYDNCASNAECFVNQHRPVCSCPDGYQGNPNVFCFIAGCRDNSDCLAQEACINEDCRDPCTLQTCGVNALCRADKRKAVCYCPEKYSGDPYVLCSRPECQSDPECPSWLACIKQECNDPCNCGPGALCRVINHRPQCSCPLDHTGDPHVQCSPLPLEGRPAADCETDGDCPSKTACFQGVCKDPCVEIKPCGRNTVCGVVDTLPYRTMTCVCLEDHIGNAYEECRLKPRDPAGCTSDDECGVSEVCRNRQCLDLCSVLKPCAPEAICEVIDKKPKCTCPPGYIGNANVNCYLIPAAEPQCTIDQDCSTDRACIDAACSDPCIVEDPCGKNALCRTQQHRPVCYCPASWAGNPKEECFKPDCTKDSECVSERACINQHCVDPCTYNGPACGIDAKCRPIMHRAQCYCPVGMQGDPLTACITVGCRSNDDCPDDRACDRLNRVCIPVCTTTTCAVGAECRARNHAATCFCPPGYSGNPFRHCSQPPLVDYPSTLPPIEPECRRDSDCPSQHACINALCVNPCAQESPCVDQQQCRVVDDEPLRTMVCECPPNQILMEGGACVRPGAVVPECQVDRDCDSDELCDAGTCRKVCRVQSCGTNAVCTPEAHTRYCTCAPGFIGDPYVACRRSPPVLDKPVPECSSNDDCPDTQSCINELCVNPCVHDPCARNAFCIVRDHVPQCTCPPGYTGDPKIACSLQIAGPRETCTRDTDCSDDMACLDGVCYSPCQCGKDATCHVLNHRPVCSCAPGYIGDPNTECRISGCSTNTDCPLTTQCINGNCTDPCELRSPCGSRAVCFVVQNQAKCRCPSGYTGDAYSECTPVGCRADLECLNDFICYEGNCKDPCLFTTCAANAKCTVKNRGGACDCLPGYEGNPYKICTRSDVVAGCKLDADCHFGTACLNGKCRNPCDAKPCGNNAVCTVVESLPFKSTKCECKQGYSGDAFIQCLPTSRTDDLCQKDDDCADDKACLSGQCSDPCKCGDGAICTVKQHRPTCTCKKGFEGSPQHACYAIGCTTTSECPNDKACYNGNCVNPCLVDNQCSLFADCRPQDHEARCFCPDGRQGDPYKGCAVIGCKVNSECPSDYMCRNNQCKDLCTHNNTCGKGALCSVKNNVVSCSCPEGQRGDPHVACVPKQDIRCLSDFDCLQGLVCMDKQCRNPCEELKPCDAPLVCSVADSTNIRTMVCKCPALMVVSEKDICSELEIPISVGCRADSDCPSNRACVNTQCVVPCNCGENAECTIVDHRPLCVCREGFQGDPITGCYKVGCTANEQCPLDKMCYNGVCVNPCYVKDPCAINAECYPEVHQAKCRCPVGMVGDPFVRCDVAGCKENSDCPTDKACHNRMCIDPCPHTDDCAPNAECYVYQHVAGCRCPSSHPFGDPRLMCEDRPIMSDVKPQCVVDGDCPSQFACINQYCRNPCFELKPCDKSALCKVVDSLPVRTMVCECPEGYLIQLNGTCKLIDLMPPPECRSSSDCGELEACVNKQCKDPCECGPNADCDIVDHRAICTCQVNFLGTPDVGCFPIGCKVDPECADDHACYEGVCANPCLVNNPCASNAECYATGHRAYCRCPIGLKGDGYNECLIIGCRSNSDCPPNHGCVNEQCADPCLNNPCVPTAECVSLDHTAKCRCPAGTAGDPNIECLPIQHPLCSVDSECPLQLACINEECKNPCHHFEPCHDTANCRVIDTEPMRTMSCMCDDSEVTKEDGVCELVPVIRPVCEADQQCPPKEACINGFCKDPCQCGANANCEIIEHHPVCTCKEGYEGDPEVGCYDIGCFSNDDCPGTHACKNAKCVPVCGPNNEPCGRESECQGVNHEAMCICPPGSRGNPNTQCIAIGCVSDDACPNERSCINQKCISPCVYDPCLDPAECKVEGHEAVCPCPPGFNRTVDNGCEKLIVGCRVDAECPSQLACVNGKCIDLCALDPCGRFAECRVVDTLPIRLVACECLPGYQGDAAEACYPVAVCPIEKGFIMDDEGKCYCPHERGFYVDDNGNCALCRTDLGFILTDDGLCICDPSKGYIVTPAGVCDCPIPMIKDEAGVCVLGTPPPLPPGCVRNEDCSTDRMCERGACVPPCGFDPCAKYALCIDANHTAICVCIAGYSGDPYKENGCKPTFARTDFPRPDMVVNCLADGVQVDINVGDPGFNGVMYVKGYSKNEECRKLIKPDVDVGTIDFKVKFNTCGLIHEDGLARFILVLQKHPKLVTYKAQAYHIKCTYNTGEKTIAIGFNVSMLTTAGTIANTGPPPTCLMKITDQYGGDITRAEIGDLLRLRVIVEPSHIYGGFARSCVALTSGDGEDIDYQVTDERGCASDPAVFEEWQLDQDKALVANFNAFKFPSSNSIRFQCNVRVCFGKCQPVNCDGYDAFGKRRRRQAAEEDAEIFFEDESTYDSQLREINVYSQSILTIESRTGRLTAPQEVQTGPDEVCVSKWGFIIALVITALLALVAVAVAVSCWLMAYRSKPKHSGPLPHPAGFPNPLFTTPQPLAEPSPDYLS
ncbi:uncharacterized protein LOC108675679 isoform X2 [Hyalella azteca]|uniref:Uncharacterized protein LOC108675679 isoform X2 n=1 Tax=Hyalella azteca TaxID=294128 RepID=A0A979FSG3_HYAAZ|nr:uncharacterized protein LOC108675679 isoform X2 [Hyalella azteca]